MSERNAVKHAMKLLLFPLLLGTFAVSQSSDPTPFDGEVRGTVVDLDGKPVSDATVYVVQESALITDAYPTEMKSDLRGSFDFGERLGHGVYRIYARKEKDGYPDRSAAFYRSPDFQPQTVQLYGAHPEATIEVKLGDRAGVLIGKVTDSDTGLPLKATMSLVRLDSGNGPEATNMVGKSGKIVNGKFRELVPANKDVVVFVQLATADFRDWSQFHAKLRLQPGEERNLDIRLFRNPAP
jgi:hypothetical protein